MRYNSSAFVKTLKTDGELRDFWHYDRSSEIQYDPDTQQPINPGSKVQEFADVLDFTISEIKNNGGLIDENSKKFILSPETVLEKGDEVIDSNLVQTYKFVFSFVFKNRTHLFANLVKDKPNEHMIAEAGPDISGNAGDTFNPDFSDSEGNIESYSYRVTDGASYDETFTGISPSFQLDQAATYTGTLTVTNAKGQTETDTNTIVVSPILPT